jgi:ribosomal-protein-alanine N-acetyltransferase
MLQTPRLRLEILQPHHAEELLAYELRNREHLAAWEPGRTSDYYTLSNIRRQLERDVEAMRDQQYVRFAALAGSPQIVAVVNLWQIRRGVNHSAILGYSVDALQQGRGYATEAAQAVIRYAFGVLNLHRLETSYQPHNERSARVLQKLGFEIEGRARKQLFLNGDWRDGILVALVNENWRP